MDAIIRLFQEDRALLEGRQPIRRNSKPALRVRVLRFFPSSPSQPVQPARYARARDSGRNTVMATRRERRDSLSPGGFRDHRAAAHGPAGGPAKASSKASCSMPMWTGSIATRRAAGAGRAFPCRGQGQRQHAAGAMAERGRPAAPGPGRARSICPDPSVSLHAWRPAASRPARSIRSSASPMRRRPPAPWTGSPACSFRRPRNGTR